VTLAHVRRGAGEPLLLLHALGGSLGQWAPVLDALAAERDVLALDMPGFGASAPLPDGTPYSAAELARAVLAFCDEAGFAGLRGVAGISLGAWVAIECARQDGAEAVVGLCPAGMWSTPPGPRRAATRAAARALGPALGALRIRAVRRRAMRGVMRHPERMSGAEAVELARGYARAPGYDEANARMRSGAVGDLSGLGVPLTLAWAEFDALVRPPKPGRLPASVTQVALPGCGHVPTWDDPELVARVILEGTPSRATVPVRVRGRASDRSAR
jgi:pimeloyl-ACP methyl ester carboxylesterase